MNTPKPYLSHQTHIREYSRYKGYKGKQANIRDSKTTRYVSTRNNPGRGKTTVRTKTVRNTKVKTNNGRNERGGRGR